MSNAQLSRRSFLGFGMATIATAALAGCTANPVRGGGGGGASGSIVIMSNIGEVTKDILSEWNKANPDIQASVLNYDATRLNAMIAAGSPPDLVRGLGAQEAPFWAARKLALPIDDFIAKSSLIKASDITKVNDAWKFDGNKQGAGSTYGLLKDYSLDLMLWLNESLFNAAGVEIGDAKTPMTYDAVLEAAEKVTLIENGKAVRYGMYTVTPSVDVIQGMLATTGGTIFSDDLKTVDFSSPEAQKALTFLAAAAKANAGYVPGSNPNPDGWDGPGYGAEKIASSQAGYWMTGYLTSTFPQAGAHSRLVAAPLLGTTRVSPTTSATGYWIPAKSKNPEGAYQFLEWFCAGAPAAARAKIGGGLPLLTSMQSSLPQGEPFQKNALDTNTNELQYASSLTFSPYALASSLTATVTDLFPQLATGALSVGKFADEATEQCNALLATGVSQVGA